MIAHAIKMTSEQFLEIGEDPPGIRLELIDGEVTVSPSPAPRHSFVDRQLTAILIAHISTNNLGELYGDVDTLFGPNDVRRPHLLYFSKTRLHLVGEKAMEGMPDLCVEILSPGSLAADRQEKFNLYQNSGVPNYWIVDPEAMTLEGYDLKAGKYVLTGKGQGEQVISLPPFKTLDIPLSRLWRRPR